MTTAEPSLYSAVANDTSTWPCVLDRCHVGMSKYVPCAAFGLISAFAFVAHTSLKHQRSTSVFHSRKGVPFIISLVDSSPNVTFMVVAKKFNIGLITPNDFVPEVLRLVSLLFDIL